MSLVSVELLDKDLWKKFCNVTNEMIVTKSGRRMFPVVKVRVRGLNPKQFYQIKLEFVQIGNNRWKYMSGGWTTGGKAESPPSQSIYRHPDSPNLGNFWMKEEGILFSKVKLTNKPNPVNDQVSIFFFFLNLKNEKKIFFFFCSIYLMIYILSNFFLII